MRFATAMILSVIVTATVPARADPQWNASLVTGICGRGQDDAYWSDTCWYNGLRADVILGRSRNSDFGAGPFASISTAGFDDLRLNGGGSLLLPLTPYFPLVLSAGGYVRHEEEWIPGASAWLFFGSKSYNFHSSYVMTGGLLLGVERDLAEPRSNTVFIGAQIDGLALVLPFVLAYEWLRGSPSEEE